MVTSSCGWARIGPSLLHTAKGCSRVVTRVLEVTHRETAELCRQLDCSINMSLKRARMTHAPVMHGPTEVFVKPDLP